MVGVKAIHVDVEPIGAIVQSNGRLGCVTEDVWMPTIIHLRRAGVGQGVGVGDKGGKR